MWLPGSGEYPGITGRSSQWNRQQNGCFLVFIGLLALLVMLGGGLSSPVSLLVIRALAIMLLVLAGLTTLTGARTAAVPMKICPFVNTGCAVSFILGTGLS